MRPEHVAANKLVDIALSGDRGAYRAELDIIKAQRTVVEYDNIVRLASMQYRLEKDAGKGRVYTGWRASWVNDKNRG